MLCQRVHIKNMYNIRNVDEYIHLFVFYLGPGFLLLLLLFPVITLNWNNVEQQQVFLKGNENVFLDMLQVKISEPIMRVNFVYFFVYQKKSCWSRYRWNELW